MNCRTRRKILTGFRGRFGAWLEVMWPGGCAQVVVTPAWKVPVGRLRLLGHCCRLAADFARLPLAVIGAYLDWLLFSPTVRNNKNTS